MSQLNVIRAKPIAIAAIVVAMCLSAVAGAADDKRTVKLKANDLAGKELSVPHASQATVLLFLRIDQEQTTDTVAGIKKALEKLPAVQVLVVLSGKLPTDRVTAFAKKNTWPVILDPEYKIVGRLQIRVWPTNIVILPSGEEVKRFTGMPQSYLRSLDAYLAFAAGRIDRAALDKSLASSDVVGDSNQQMAARHLQVARRMMEKRMLDQAWRELGEALKLQPNDPELQLTKAEILLLLNKPSEAVAVLNGLDAKSTESSRFGLLKGSALVAMGKFDQAIEVLKAAVKLNPNPGEAYYYLGVAYQNKKLWPQAAAAFRAAFEATPLGRTALPSKPAKSGVATTRPAPE
jgi:tetratricopeptide (TPR) repeat protein